MNKHPKYSRIDTTPFTSTDEEWREYLDEKTFQVARLKGTEYPFSGEYIDEKSRGNYYCKMCGNHLFHSTQKFESGCGWPSFTESAVENAMDYKTDLSHNMKRIEVTCRRCQSHLGHVFNDGPPPLYKRYCINSICLEFEPENV